MSSLTLVARSALLFVVVGASACAVTPRTDLLGTPIAASAATRTLELTPDTRYVNVIAGDSVRFVSAGQAFGWSFDVSPIVSVFSLNQVAPAGALSQPVLVYVAPDPRYSEPTDANRRH